MVFIFYSHVNPTQAPLPPKPATTTVHPSRPSPAPRQPPAKTSALFAGLGGQSKKKAPQPSAAPMVGALVILRLAFNNIDIYLRKYQPDKLTSFVHVYSE